MYSLQPMNCERITHHIAQAAIIIYSNYLGSMTRLLVMLVNNNTQKSKLKLQSFNWPSNWHCYWHPHKKSGIYNYPSIRKFLSDSSCSTNHHSPQTNQKWKGTRWIKTLIHGGRISYHWFAYFVGLCLTQHGLFPGAHSRKQKFSSTSVLGWILHQGNHQRRILLPYLEKHFWTWTCSLQADK